MGYIGNEPTTGHFPVQTNLVGPGPTYTLTQAPANAGAIEVSVAGVLQPTTAYSVSGTTLTMAGVATGIPIFIRHLGETLSIPVPGDGTVTDAKIVTGAVTDAKIADVAASKLTGTVDVARLPSTVLNSNVPPSDTSVLEYNVAMLAFKVASANQLAKFSMVDQVIDEYQDATGIDAGASTNELAGGATTAKYYEGGSTVTPTVVQDADATGVDGDYTWYKWTDTGSTGSFSINAAQTIEYLIVAGGGSGGRGNSGGGGAGGLIATTGVSYPAGTPTWTVTVGAGGVGPGPSNGVGVDGSNSILSGTGLSTQTAIGGGGGGTAGGGNPGGSGGGNSHGAAGAAATPAAGTAGQGNDGGGSSGSAPQYGGGAGGGAGAAGGAGTANNGGDGGIGLQNDITGTNLYYAGGGGGSTNYSTAAAGAGGNGGGGQGAGNDGLITLAQADGDDNTGGGGGSIYVSLSRTGSGGSGVVIIRRLTSIESSGGNLTLQSVATTAESAPTTANLVVLIEDSGSGTADLASDIKAKVSRDGSAFTGYVTFTDEGNWGTDKRILRSNDIDLTGVTSGTAMKYKIETFNQSAGVKETRIHATSLAWA